MPLDTFYLPKEAVSFVNYPVLREEQANIETVMNFALRVNSALSDYNEARYTKIDLNMDEVETHITLCRATSAALGLSDKVPYDILLELRSVQTQLQNIRVLFRTFGNSLIGTPGTETAQGGGV